MAKNISETNPLTEIEYLNELKNCMETAKKHDKMVSKFGKMTAFARSTKESEELAMNQRISKAMKMALNKMSDPTEGRKKRQANTIDQIIDDNCNLLTQRLRNSMACSEFTDCDPVSEFRQISGCCSNLRNKSFGKKYLDFANKDINLYRCSIYAVSKIVASRLC